MTMRMTTRQYGLLAALVPLALGACAGGVVTGEYHSAFYTPELTAYTVRNGVMPTAVYGTAWDKAGLADLLAALELPAGHPPARLAMTPAAQAGELGRVVLVFDPAPEAADGTDACRLKAGDTVPSAASDGRTRVLVAFCHGTGLAAESMASVPRAGGPTDPVLVAGINGALQRTLRTDDPNKSSDCGPPC